MNAYSPLAYMSVEEMRILGIPEDNIAIIEQHRPALPRQHMLSQMQLSQLSHLNFALWPTPVLGQAGEAGDSSQMHPEYVMQLPQYLVQHNPQGWQTIHQQTLPAQTPNIPQVYTRPTAAQMNSAREFIRRASGEQIVKLKRCYQPELMRDGEQFAYVHSFKPFFNLVVETEKRLVMFHALFQDYLSTQKLITIILTAKEQNRLLSTDLTQYILPLSAVTRLMTELRMVVDRIQQALVRLPPQTPAPLSDIQPPSDTPTPSNPPPNPPPPAVVNQIPVVNPQVLFLETQERVERLQIRSEDLEKDTDHGRRR